MKNDVWDATQPAPLGGTAVKHDIWDATRPAPLDEPPSPSRAASPLLNAKVMIVDDEPLMIELVQAHLEDGGYTNFVSTSNPGEALGLMRREQPGVLLLDLMMPNVSGFEVLAAIRADRELRYTPVIVLTASTGSDYKLRALQLGATDFLGKPVDASELVLRVRNTLAFRQYHSRMLHYDQVTGLPKQGLFDRGIDALVERSPLVGGLVALFSITVPECRRLRESLDQNSADELAKAIARRLERLAHLDALQPAMATSTERAPRVARLGEEHFALVVEGLEDTDAVETVARSLLATLVEPVALGLHEVAPAPWIGVAVSPGDGNDAETLRRCADLAATHARQRGAGQFAFASPELNARSYHRLTLGAQLRGAAQRGELRLHYQPKVDVATQRIVGMEALVRWQHPDRGLVPPNEFIALAEELGLMGSIGRWVIERACADTAAWTAAGLGELKIAVNVSKVQFTAGDLCSVVRQAMFDSGLPARQLVVEVTESMLMDDVPACLRLMNDLKAIGVTLSIDDFGTGYSSLAYLKRFPLDELKIDRSFVIDLPGTSADLALVRTVIDLGHSLGMTVTAEGVERADQLACLQRLGCDTFQGFLFSRPLPKEQFAELLTARRQQPAATLFAAA